MLRKLCCVVSMAVALGASSQVLPYRHHARVLTMNYSVSASNYDYASVARQAAGDAVGQYDKAKNLYLWICANIDYDASGKLRKADECWNMKKAVCQGYCELYFRMAEALGIRSRLVYGKSKNARAQSRFEEHSWLIVTTERGDVLLDPTWGAGSMVDGKFARLSEPLVWFDVDPCWFIFTHHPNNKRWQYLKSEVTYDQFVRLPYVSPLVSKLGVPPEDALQDVLNGGDAFPIMPVRNASFLNWVKLIDVPNMLHLQRGETYVFTVAKQNDGCKLELKNGNDTMSEEAWTQEDGMLKICVTPHTAGRLQMIVTGGNEFLPIRKTVLEYIVE